MLNLNAEKDTLKGDLKLSDCETHHIVKWLSGSPQASFYIGDKNELKDNIFSFISEEKECLIKLESYKKYLNNIKKIIEKYGSMYHGPANTIEDVIEHFARMSEDDAKIILSYRQGDRYIRILNTKKDFERNRSLYGIDKLVNGEQFRNSFVGGITNITIKKENEGYTIDLKINENWREILMQENGEKVKLESVVSIFNDEMNNNIEAGQNEIEAGRIFGIKYAPLLEANKEKFSYKDVINSSNHNSQDVIEAVESGISISPTILWSLDEPSNNEVSNDFEVNIDNFDSSIISSKNLFGIHIENRNNALSDEDPHICIGWSKCGDLSIYSSKEEIKDLFIEQEPNLSNSSINQCVGQISRFLFDTRVNDFVIYSNQEEFNIGQITSEYYYKEPNESLQDKDYTNNRDVQWLFKGLKRKELLSDRFNSALKAGMSYFTLNDYKEELIEIINKLKCKPYNKENFLKDVYIEEDDYDKIFNTLINKKNLILQGAPGVGKTFSAKRLAYSIIGKQDDRKIKLVQFHQSYSYEDFIMGYRPKDNGFKLETGIFYDFCDKARKDKENKYFFIIDEINRGQLSKIFGELLMLIEKDKRDKEYVSLAYNKEPFTVPSNLYLIGMMNTADRSLAFIDYALRRRFSFYYMKPAFYNDKFSNYIESLNSEKLKKVINSIKEINKKISNNSFGSGFEIGHSYFCNFKDDYDDDKLKSIVEFEIIPMIEEYFIDDQGKVDEYSKLLRNSLND